MKKKKEGKQETMSSTLFKNRESHMEWNLRQFEPPPLPSFFFEREMITKAKIGRVRYALDLVERPIDASHIVGRKTVRSLEQKR